MNQSSYESLDQAVAPVTTHSAQTGNGIVLNLLEASFSCFFPEINLVLHARA